MSRMRALLTLICMLTLKADEYQNVGLHVLFSQFGVTDLQPARSHSRLDRNRGLVTARRDKHRTFIQEIRVHVIYFCA